YGSQGGRLRAGWKEGESPRSVYVNFLTPLPTCSRVENCFGKLHLPTPGNGAHLVEPEPRIFKLAETVDVYDDSEANDRLKDTLAKLSHTRLEKKSIKTIGPPQALDVEDRRRSLAYKKLSESKAARYKVVAKKRGTSMEEGLPYRVLDVLECDDSSASNTAPGDAYVLENLIPIVNEYLRVTESTKEEQLEAEDSFVYDIYYQDNTEEPVMTGTVASLTWDDEEGMFVNDESDSDEYDDDEDSNEPIRPAFTKLKSHLPPLSPGAPYRRLAEDNYRNDYPDASDDEASEKEEWEEGSGSESDE
ncbi:hypothetical protein BDK51DRAFT_33110, partial [Blyttiomyces helicus]